MIQGTGSSVGKSLIVTALCRIFHQDGFRVAPFKSQNMALNSFITKEGLEMGRAQVAQAEAARKEPDVNMNPILLKPTADVNCQVIVKGKVYKNMSAKEYCDFKPYLREVVAESYRKLAMDNDIVVIEGAGSPAEINLREGDIVNMGMAEIADAPVILVGDIDKGGVFASLTGTMLLLNHAERRRIKGVLINKFRGDLKILKPGIYELERIIKRPNLGVVPYMDVRIDDEDGSHDRLGFKSGAEHKIDVKVIRLPHISNFTDFNPLECQEDVALNYVAFSNEIGEPDVLIIPGSKNTLADLQFIRNRGIDKKIFEVHRKGGIIIGICGGFQMLGKEIHDPYHVESDLEYCNGLGLIDGKTIFSRDKVTTQVKARINVNIGPFEGLQGVEVEGYEIHMGETVIDAEVSPLVLITERLEDEVYIPDGAVSDNGRVFGTYIHGIFDNMVFTRAFLNNIRKNKGWDPLEIETKSYREIKDREYDRLAEIVRESVDMDSIYKIIGLY